MYKKSTSLYVHLSSKIFKRQNIKEAKHTRERQATSSTEEETSESSARPPTCLPGSQCPDPSPGCCLQSISWNHLPGKPLHPSLTVGRPVNLEFQLNHR